MRSLISLAMIAGMPVMAFCQQSAPYTQELTQNGTSVRISIEPTEAHGAGARLMEGQPVTVRFKLTDVESHSPVPGASPAAWIDLKGEGQRTSAEACAGKIRRLAEGSTFSRTELDLTAFFVITLNADPTVTVVDPRFGHGDTRLLALVQLESPGEDWALTADGRRLYISMPDANKVAVVDTVAWKVIANVAVPHAARVGLQPDGAYLWVGYSADGGDSGVAVVNTRDLKTVARIRTGHGYHHFAFSPDSSYVFVTNYEEGTVAVIDVRKLAKIKDIPVGARPLWIAFSGLAQAAYVANEGDGSIAAIDARDHRVVARMTAAPGMGQIKFAPGGRYGFALNPSNDHVYIVDAATNRIVQRGKLEKEPDQVSFTNKQAHIRHRGSDTVLMIGLDTIGQEGAPLNVADFTGGRHAPGAMSRTTPADGIVQASGDSAVLVANPGDKSIYFYMEGMAAPMGNFSNYGREPRAVLVVDRNLREKSPGTYETTTKLPSAGSYDLAFLFDRPRIVGCVDVSVEPDPAVKQERPPAVKVEPQGMPSGKVGEPVHFTFRLTSADTGQPDTEVRDITVLAMSPMWQARQIATHVGKGIYSADFTIPTAGSYAIFLTSPSRGLGYIRCGGVMIESPAK